VKAAFGLGSNLGDRRAHLEEAIRGLAALGRVLAISTFHDTAPLGPPQPRYLNAAVIVETELEPRELLRRARELERRAGRVRGERWGARTLDVDLLLYGDRVVHEPDLTVPHPRLHERRFVLAPLSEVALDWVVPGRERTVGELLADLQEHS
jgi:2-amino-4-hydroxy-6-hydroxymethyldihydropteridine diphosphokinase